MRRQVRHRRQVLLLEPSPEPLLLRNQIDRRIRSDYREGRIETIEGWVLSRTEARLCALAALRASDVPAHKS